MSGDLFVPGIPVDHVLRRLNLAGGKEVSSGKFASAESSAALAVNTFGWFIERPHLFPSFPGVATLGSVDRVDIEYCARFPWSGGRHPWLDAIVETTDTLIGVESKRFEPYRDRKAVSLSAAYDRPVWGDAMQPFQAMRDQLRSGGKQFAMLDATQLVKHAFGLVTDAGRKQKRAILLYLYAESPRFKGASLGSEAFEQHRAEIAAFDDAVAGAAVAFHAVSYREWLQSWSDENEELVAHREAILQRFKP
jgi:hypothetical protein